MALEVERGLQTPLSAMLPKISCVESRFAHAQPHNQPFCVPLERDGSAKLWGGPLVDEFASEARLKSDQPAALAVDRADQGSIHIKNGRLRIHDP